MEPLERNEGNRLTIRRYHETNRPDNNILIILAIVFNFSVSMGFPGRWLDYLPGFVSSLCEYGSFAAQLVLMLLSSGDSLLDIKLIDLKKKYIVIYIMLAEFFVVSMLVTSMPKEQAISCIRFTVTGLYAIFLVERFGEKRVMEFAYYAQVLFVLFTLLHFLRYPGNSFSYEDGGTPSFCGLFYRKNGCATEIYFGIILQTILYKIRLLHKERPSRFFIIFMLVQCVLLVACRSAGAIISCLATVAYLWIWDHVLNDRRRIPLGIFNISLSVGFLFFAMTILPLFGPVFEAMGKDATLSSRTDMWEQHIYNMQQTHTMTGFGFNMFWRDPSAVKMFHSRFDKNTWFASMTSGSHNVILELWLNVGLLGITAYFAALLYSFRNIHGMKKDQYIMCSAIMIVFTIGGLTERAYTPSDYTSMFLFIMLASGCNRPPKENAVSLFSGHSKGAVYDHVPARE